MKTYFLIRHEHISAKVTTALCPSHRSDVGWALKEKHDVTRCLASLIKLSLNEKKNFIYCLNIYEEISKI